MSSLHLTACGFQKSSEIETTGSPWLRGTLGALGVAALVGGALIHFKMVLPQLIGVVSWTCMGGGATTALIGAYIKIVKEEAQSQPSDAKNERKDKSGAIEQKTQPQTLDPQKMTNEAIAALSTAELNSIIHKLSQEQLLELPIKFFEDEALDLSSLSKDQIHQAFAVNSSRFKQAAEKIQKLPLKVLLQILPHFTPLHLNFVPVERIVDSDFVWPKKTSKVSALMRDPDIYLAHNRHLSLDPKVLTIIRQLPDTTLNSLMPFMIGFHLLSIPEAFPQSCSLLDWQLVTDDQILKIPLNLREDKKEPFSKVLECLSIERINQLIPKMSEVHRECIPVKHLQNNNLDLKSFKEFFKDILDYGKKVKYLSTQQLNSIMNDLPVYYLRGIHDDRLKDPHLDLSGLSAKQVEVIFSVGGWRDRFNRRMINNDHKEVARRLGLLSSAHLNQILSKMSLSQVSLLIHKDVLDNETFKQVNFQLVEPTWLGSLFFGEDADNEFARLTSKMQEYVRSKTSL